MNPKQLENIRWFKSRPTLLEIDTTRIDLERGIIRDVVMVQEGPAKGHDMHLEREFIEAITAYDQKFYSKIGLKARFGHPGASSETMGTQLGIYTNFRTREKDGILQEIADLKVLDSAEFSPTHPGMKSWVLSMAQERPDFIMSSIVFKGSGYYQRKSDGKKERMKLAWDEDGPYWENYESDLPLFVEFDAKNGAGHFYTDLVEQGAATESLLSAQVNPHLYVAQADEFLHDHPHIKSFMQQHPDKVAAFLATVGVHINLKMAQETPPKTLLQKFLAAFSAEDEQAFRQEIFALQTAKDAADKRVEQLTAQVDSLQTTVNELKTAADNHTAELAKRDERITELEGLAADVPTGGPVPPNGTDKKDEKYSAEQQDKIREKLRSK